MLSSPTFKFVTQDICFNNFKTDILILWTSSSLLAGDETFINVHKEAGSSVKKEIYNIKYDYKLENFKFGDNVVTNSGILKIDKIIHSVLPNSRIITDKIKKQNLLTKTLFSIKETIKYFESTNYKILHLTFLPLSGKIYGEVTDKDIELYLSYICSEFKDFHTITIVFNSEEERKKYLYIFNKKNNSFLKKIKEYVKDFRVNFKIPRTSSIS